MSSELKQFADELKRHASEAKPKDYAAMLGTMVQEIANYVETYNKEKDLVSKIGQLRTKVKERPETPEEEAELKDAQEAFQAAKDAERHLSEKKMYLGRLEQAVSGLLSNIRKAR